MQLCVFLIPIQKRRNPNQYANRNYIKMLHCWVYFSGNCAPVLSSIVVLHRPLHTENMCYLRIGQDSIKRGGIVFCRSVFLSQRDNS